MSRSPTEASPAPGDDYTAAWEAVHRFVREGGSWSGNEHDVALQNDGRGRFVDVSIGSGLDSPRDGRAAALSDVDGDGGIDLWTMTRDGTRLRLYANVARRGSWIAFDLIGSGANRDAIGARVELALSADGPRRWQTLRAGHGYLAQSSKVVHFGLGDAQLVEGVIVHWPGGEREEFGPCAANARYTLRRGTGSAEPRVSTVTRPALLPAPVEPLERSSGARVVFGTPVPLPPLPAATLGGVTVDAADLRGRPRLLVPWASWCAPCIAELNVLAAARERLQAAGIDVVLLAVDETEEAQQLDAVLRAISWPFEALRADPQAVAALDLLQKHVLERRQRLTLPCSFLVNGAGGVETYTRGPLDLDALVDDALFAASSPTPAARRDRAVPFAGQWSRPPAGSDALEFEQRLRAEGLVALADAYHPRALASVARIDSGLARTHLEIGLARLQQRRLEDAERELRIAVELDPTLADAWSGIGMIVHRRGEFAAAIAAFRRALRERPDDLGARFNLGVAQLDAGDVEEARATAAHLSRTAPDLAARLEDLVRARQARDD